MTYNLDIIDTLEPMSKYRSLRLDEFLNAPAEQVQQTLSLLGSTPQLTDPQKQQIEAHCDQSFSTTKFHNPPQLQMILLGNYTLTSPRCARGTLSDPQAMANDARKCREDDS